MGRTHLWRRLAGGRAEYGCIEAGGIVVRREGLRRLAGGNVAARSTQFGQNTGGDPRLPDIGPGADDAMDQIQFNAAIGIPPAGQ